MSDGNSLLAMNDTDRYTFDQIAEVIKSNPEGLFRNV